MAGGTLLRHPSGPLSHAPPPPMGTLPTRSVQQLYPNSNQSPVAFTINPLLPPTPSTSHNTVCASANPEPNASPGRQTRNAREPSYR